MEPIEPQEHYVATVESLPPTKITCACGATFTGKNLMVEMEAHVDMQDAIVELEQTLERRNVFDKNDKDEESP